ncbi:MAG: saccharopine dehydrogenase [Saprospirales bacterium]|nr:MAG: saccharopine dehydrogenase [Saprospirales bacterium]
MNKVLILGAGRSSSALINYLLREGEVHNWTIAVADRDISAASSAVGESVTGMALELDINDPVERRKTIGSADIVVSLLPAFFHNIVASDCLELNKHLITASYVSSEMHDLAEKARSKGLVFMGEMGLDPGIDHMSAMEKIDEIKESGGTIHSFRSYTGGLVAPESDDNPWHYKFTWNPRNVVLAGMGTAQYLKEGRYKYIPYHRLFSRKKEVEIQGLGKYEMYPNRDSLLYRYAYKIEDIPTIVRGTLRHLGFCEAWDVFVKLGLTDDSYPIVNSEHLTYKELVESYLREEDQENSLFDRIASFTGLHPDSDALKKIEWTGLFSNEKIDLPNATPAQILEKLLLEKWKLQPHDKDMIIMQHEFVYTLNGKKEELVSTMTLKGENANNTAMSKLVGLPVAIFVSLMLKGVDFRTDETRPVIREVYQPVLRELEKHGVVFQEKIRELV